MRPITLIVGGGPAGLATAAALRARNMRSIVIERADAVGASWRGHYDRLHLHTPRRFSGLPGLAIPKRYGRWVARDDVARYLRQYADYHDLDVRTGTSVTGLQRTGGRWTVEASTTDGGTLNQYGADFVVLATGYNGTAVVPDWAGRESYAGTLLHARDYREPSAYAGRSVLVVGAGNSGAEIAADLADPDLPEDQRPSKVWLSVRTPPHIVRRDSGPMSAQLTGIAVRRLPPRIVDPAARALGAIQLPDLSDFGLPRPTDGLYTRVNQGAIPVQDVGLVDGVRRQRIEPVPAVRRFFGDDVILSDARRLRPDVVIAATGYRPALEALVGGLIDLDERGRPVQRGASEAAPGLYVNGYTNPISGMLREIRIDANRIARRIARQAQR